MAKIDVFVRHINRTSANLLCSVSTHDELHALACDIRETGIYCSASGDVEHAAKVQYVLDDEGAYTEIIIGTED